MRFGLLLVPLCGADSDRRESGAKIFLAALTPCDFFPCRLWQRDSQLLGADRVMFLIAPQ